MPYSVLTPLRDSSSVKVTTSTEALLDSPAPIGRSETMTASKPSTVPEGSRLYTLSYTML